MDARGRTSYEYDMREVDENICQGTADGFGS